MDRSQEHKLGREEFPERFQVLTWTYKQEIDIVAWRSEIYIHLLKYLTYLILIKISEYSWTTKV